LFADVCSFDAFYRSQVFSGGQVTGRTRGILIITIGKVNGKLTSKTSKTCTSLFILNFGNVSSATKDITKAAEVIGWMMLYP